MKEIIRKDFIHADLSYKIIGCAFSVYNSIGAGHLEKIYQQALAVALKNAGLKFKEQASCPVFYEGVKVGIGYADFLVEEKILLELKRGHFFSPADFNQLNKYLVARDLQLGIMFRFAPEQLLHKRVVNLTSITQPLDHVEEPGGEYLIKRSA